MPARKTRRWAAGAMLGCVLLVLNGCTNKDNESPDSSSQLAIQRWPGEGLPVIAWTGSGDRMAVYACPGDTIPTESVAVIPKQRLEWDESLIVVRQPGRMEILEDCVIEGFVYDSLDQGTLTGGQARQINLSSGTILEVICYTAEGYYIFRHLGEYIEMEASHECQQMLNLPETEWWVRLEEKDRPAGWIRADQEDISVVERKF